MEVMEAIRTRRSTGRMLPDPVPREHLEQMIEAATWAPNHHGTEPWKFWVMTGEGRGKLGQVYADIALAAADGASEAERRDIQDREYAKAFRAPVIVAVAVAPSPHDKAIWIEEVEAGAAAVQNLLLAAHALGYATIWRSGAPMYAERMKQLFGLAGEKDQLIGLVYIGKPAGPLPHGTRQPAGEKTVWWT